MIGTPTERRHVRKQPDTEQERARAIAVDAESVYWAVGIDTGAVMKIPIDGGKPVTLASTTHPTSIAADATSIYWLDTVDGTVMKLTPK